jgi:hypothetical protein
MFNESSPGREIAFDPTCQGSRAVVPVETQTPYDILDAKEQRENPADKDIYQAASGPRRFEWGRLVRLPAEFIASVVNLNSPEKLSDKKVRAILINSLLIVSIIERNLTRTQIAKMTGASVAAVSQHANRLITMFGTRALLPGERSEEYRQRCSRAKSRRKETVK